MAWRFSCRKEFCQRRTMRHQDNSLIWRNKKRCYVTVIRLLKKQGRTLLLLAALAGAALFLCLAACNGDDKSAQTHASAPGYAVRGGIVPDSASSGDLMYEEEPAPGFTDYISQVDFAVARAMQRAGISIDGIRVERGPLHEHAGHLYHPQTLRIFDVSNIPDFVQALRDSLLAWAGQAALVRLPDGSWQIVVDGSITHSLFLFSTPGYGDGSGGLDGKRPQLVIVIDDLGESKRQASRLLALDYPVAFAIWPHSTHASAVSRMAHEAGADVLVHQPMEPEGYPRVNPGKGVLLSGMSAGEMESVLKESLRLVPHAQGLNNHMGSRLTQNEEAMSVVSGYLAARGYVILDSLTHAKSRFAKAAAESGAQTYRRDIFLDVEDDRDKILAQLRKAERVALVKGQAVVIGHPLANTLLALEQWQHERNTQIDIVRLRDLTPISPASSSSGNNGNF